MSDKQKNEQASQDKSNESKKPEPPQRPEPIKFEKTVRMNNDSSDD